MISNSLKHSINEWKSSKKLMIILPLLLLVSACAREDITESSTGFWQRGVVYTFIQIIEWLSNIFGGNYGIGIIVFTIIISIILMPVMHIQYKSMRRIGDLQPEVEKIKAKYPLNDRESQLKIQEETQQLYKDNGINQLMGCLPIFAQMPVLMALYQAVYYSPVLRNGHFLWLNLGKPDPYFLLPILAGIFTFLTSWLSMKSQAQQNSMSKSMTFIMPVFIAFMAIPLPSAVSLYWVTRNIFSVLQTLLLNNPYKINAEREEKLRLERKRQREIEKAWRRQKAK
ncbi:YidC/Oxa1 family membrane protein insertase [Atopobacter phocae]|uniref:YidC/Oxa1 family membrane protein insertase n=1 Tax=Atopobacter phocae TaxID=136492 RepID=UPI00046FE0E4|nr:YidC/Oxa1 family membrane protein insertase [Atopobacter phocae]